MLHILLDGAVAARSRDLSKMAYTHRNYFFHILRSLELSLVQWHKDVRAEVSVILLAAAPAITSELQGAEGKKNIIRSFNQ